MTQGAMLVFARSIGFVSRAPGFSHPSVPALVRVGLALALTIAIAPAQHPRALPLAQLVLALAGEAAIGVAIGLASSLVYEAAYDGGRLVDDYVGIRGSVPHASLAGSVGFGRLWSSVFVVVYFLAGAYGPVLAAYGTSFARLPAGAPLDAVALRAFAIAFPEALARVALAVAGPAIAVAAIVHCASGAIGRLVPRMSNFSLAFPVVFGAALIVTLAGAPLLLPLAAHPPLDLRFLHGR